MVRVVSIRGDYVYTLTSSVVQSKALGGATVYGLAIRPLNGSHRQAVVEAISDDFNVVFDLFGWIVDDELLPEHLLKAVKDYLVGQYPKIIPLSRYLNRPLIA